MSGKKNEEEVKESFDETLPMLRLKGDTKEGLEEMARVERRSVAEMQRIVLEDAVEAWRGKGKK